MESNICRQVVGTSESSRCRLNTFEHRSELETASLVMSLRVFPGPKLFSKTSEVFRMDSIAARSASVEVTLNHWACAESSTPSSSSRELGMWGNAYNNANRVMTHSVATIQIRLPLTGSGEYTMVRFLYHSNGWVKKKFLLARHRGNFPIPNISTSMFSTSLRSGGDWRVIT